MSIGQLTSHSKAIQKQELYLTWFGSMYRCVMAVIPSGVEREGECLFEWVHILLTKRGREYTSQDALSKKRHSHQRKRECYLRQFFILKEILPSVRKMDMPLLRCCIILGGDFPPRQEKGECLYKKYIVSEEAFPPG